MLEALELRRSYRAVIQTSQRGLSPEGVIGTRTFSILINDFVFCPREMFAFKIAFVLSLFCCSSNRFRFLLVLIRFHSPSLDLTLSHSFSLSSLSSPFAFIRCRLCGRNWSNRLMIAPNQAAFFISADWEPLGTHKTRRRNLKAQEVFELRTFAALERPINVRKLRNFEKRLIYFAH